MGFSIRIFLPALNAGSAKSRCSDGSLTINTQSILLFDNKSFTHNIETAYSIVFEKFINKKNPEDIYL